MEIVKLLLLTILIFVIMGILTAVGFAGFFWLTARMVLALPGKKLVEFGTRLGSVRVTKRTFFGDRELRGTFRNRPVRIYHETRGRRRGPKMFLCLEMKWRNAAGMEFLISRQGLAQDLGTWITGKQDIRLGVPSFDNRVLLKGNQEEKIASIFDAILQKRILDLWSARGSSR